MRQTLQEISEAEIGGHSGLQMLITATVASNWAILWMMFLYIGDMVPLEEAVTLALGVNMALFIAYFILRHLPAIAGNILVIEQAVNGDRQ